MVIYDSLAGTNGKEAELLPECDRKKLGVKCDARCPWSVTIFVVPLQRRTRVCLSYAVCVCKQTVCSYLKYTHIVHITC